MKRAKKRLPPPFTVRMTRLEAAWREIIRSMGYNPADPHLVGSPARVTRFLWEWHTNERQPPTLTTFPANGYESMVAVGHIRFHSMCAHHGLPFFGVGAVGYIPQARIVGLSKLARVLDHFSRRFQTQEGIAKDVADHLERHLEPRGVGVVLRAEHLCMSMRGIRSPGHRTITSDLRGVFRTNPATRAELLALVEEA